MWDLYHSERSEFGAEIEAMDVQADDCSTIPPFQRSKDHLQGEKIVMTCEH
jgi:hypothetical protein